ncbi:MAG: DUF1631 family protein [Pseudomonadales bacterium]|nr:DUF1631 family protein [Pseudomonadales bacterium]MDG1443549.1 DUF1631 family protein [Pseudomonadales bacterium]
MAYLLVYFNTLSEIVEKLQKTAIRSLNLALQTVLDENNHSPAIARSRDDILMNFVENMNKTFDKLAGTYKEDKIAIDFESLSLVQDEELTAMVAVEGMVAASRNQHLASFISFNTRLNALFDDATVNESTNPLDPQQVAASFTKSIIEAKIDSADSLKIYRSFNAHILKNIDKIIRESNQLLIDNGVMPKLSVDTIRARPSPSRTSARQETKAPDTSAFGTVEEDHYKGATEQPELFSMMQNLMHQDQTGSANALPMSPDGSTMQGAPGAMQNRMSGGMIGTPQQYAVPASMIANKQSQGVIQAFTPAEGEQVEMVDQAQLMSILTNIQKSLDVRNQDQVSPNSLQDVNKIDISSSLGEMLQDTQEEGVIAAVDRQSSDIINLVTLLYDAIWQDESVPIPIKELIGRTQITIIKIALSDTTFFNKEDHPARMILNEFAEAGIGWTEVDNLAEDPLYRKIESLVAKIQQNFDGEIAFIENLIKDFRNFKAKEVAKTRQLEQSILKSKERKERLGDIEKLVSQKIEERVLGRELHPLVVELLDLHFHKFMVMLVLKEGPGSNAWKQSINTIDVLLWSVEPHQQRGDRKRLETVNPRLLNNLKKALRIAQIEASEVNSLITRLQEVQEETFGFEEQETSVEPTLELSMRDESSPVVASAETVNEATETDRNISTNEPDATDIDPSTSPSANESIEEEQDEVTALSEDDPIFDQIDALSVGIWVEFIGIDSEQPIRCKLAAKINAIDKFIFVNRQGVKVVEKTRTGLAQEIFDGTVKIISDGLLFSRALESVIGDLRDAQHVQHTGGAYQKDSAGA